MRRASSILSEMEQIVTVQDLTGVFESIASTRVAKIRDKVELSTEFFDRLWRLYIGLGLDPGSAFSDRQQNGNSRSAFIMISAEGGLSGDIDQRMMERVVKDYDATTTDLMVIGEHGASQLIQRGITFTNYFKVPLAEEYVDVSQIITALQPYAEVSVYYEAYVSLGVQEIKVIDLISQARSMSALPNEPADVIDLDAETVFEPSLDAITRQMEQTMIGLALSQVILESSLAQDASRFNAMAVAKKRSQDLVTEYNLTYHRAKRSESDLRLHEVMIGLKKKKKRRA